MPDRITNAIWSDYASMAVRTGGPGASGLSVMVVRLKRHPGVTMRRIKVAGQMSAGTTYIELDDVKVPVENLIGQEGMGMRYIMTNFNHERTGLPSFPTTFSSAAQSITSLNRALYCRWRDKTGSRCSFRSV